MPIFLEAILFEMLEGKNLIYYQPILSGKKAIKTPLQKRNQNLTSLPQKIVKQKKYQKRPKKIQKMKI